MEKHLVNILTPAYNAASYIHRLLDSILMQTYPLIEMFVIDDGSTDSTADIVKKYIPKFEERGYILNYRYQKNQGVSSTINNGLKLLNGEYFVWPDIDDWYASPLSIQKLVDALKTTGDDVGVSRCAYNRIHERDMRVFRVDYPKSKNGIDYLFDVAVKRGDNFWLEPGGWMIKLKFIDDIIPDREIYTSELTGQNAQILWPYLYYKKCVSIEEPLFNYLVRKNSHSRDFFKGINLKIQQKLAYEKTFLLVLSSIKDLPEEDLEHYSSYIKACTNKAIFGLSFEYKNSGLIQRYYKQLEMYQNNIPISKNEKLIYYTSFIPGSISFISNLIKVKNDIGKFYNLRCFFVCVLLFSIAFNIAMSYMVIAPIITKKYYGMAFTPIETTSSQAFEEMLLKGVYTLLNDEVGADESIIYYKTIPQYIHHIVHRKKYSVFEYGEYGYLLHYTFMYAQKKGDNDLMDLIKQKIDNGLLQGRKTLSVTRNDQISYGCILTDLYLHYKEDTYQQCCEQLFNRLDSLYKADGVILYHNGDKNQHVDCIGLVCPFLYAYANTFESERAKYLVEGMISEYIKYGLDPMSGLPAQAYHTKTKIKNLRSNWGRGVSWFCLGLKGGEFVESNVINKMDSTLLSLAPIYSQYLGQQEQSLPDMSATIPILYYLSSKNKIEITKTFLIDNIARYVGEDGIVRFNSPTIGYPDEAPNAFQGHHLTQGLTLYFLSTLRE